MAQTQSETQLPIGRLEEGADESARVFERGLELGREYAGQAIRRIAAWAEENPGGLLLAGLAAGFVLGKVLFRPRRAGRVED